MTRIQLGGKGESIPSIALPGANVDETFPPVTLLFTENGVFNRVDYINLGYTNFEVWCIGAAGGRGGMNTMPARFSAGGGGGGGGLHRVHGLLADLSDYTPIVIGQAGNDGQDSNGTGRFYYALSKGYPEEDPVNWSYTLAIIDTGARPLTRGGNVFINADGSYVSPYTKVDIRGNPVPSDYDHAGWDGTPTIPVVPYLVRPHNVYTPLPPEYTYSVLGTIHIEQTDGADGGYSEFGTIAKASGGKGGKKSELFSILNTAYGLTEIAGGDGGEGGIGDRTVAGGGGAGGWTEEQYLVYPYYDKPSAFIPHVPEDGTWDDAIGKGGGGGRGGSTTTISMTIFQAAQNGARGSFNFGDTTAHGPKQNKYNDPYYSKSIMGGGGGGAKLPSSAVYGGRSAGANPNGAVFIRMTKIDP